MTTKPHPLADLDWKHPSMVGASEYTAIYECLMDGTEEEPTTAEARTLAIAMLNEFELWARVMGHDLGARSCTQCGDLYDPNDADVPAGLGLCAACGDEMEPPED